MFDFFMQKHNYLTFILIYLFDNKIKKNKNETLTIKHEFNETSNAQFWVIIFQRKYSIYKLE